MKTLIIYDRNGEVLMSMGSDYCEYPCTLISQDIQDNYDIIGVDLSTGTALIVDSSISNTKRQQKYDELMKKNKDYLFKEEYKQLKAENKELNNELKEKVNRLEKSNVEIINYVTDMAETNENNN